MMQTVLPSTFPSPGASPPSTAPPSLVLLAVSLLVVVLSSSSRRLTCRALSRNRQASTQACTSGSIKASLYMQSHAITASKLPPPGNKPATSSVSQSSVLICIFESPSPSPSPPSAAAGCVVPRLALDFDFDFAALLLLLDLGFLVDGRLEEIFCRSNFRT